MERYKITHNTWNKVANLYEEKFMDLDIYNKSYDDFCKTIVKKNPSILEIGCGPGNIAKYLLSKRPDFNILGLDIAPNMVALATKNNPTASFSVMDGRDILKLNKKFDAIIAGFYIPYISKSERLIFIKNCSSLLSNKGVLYLSFVNDAYHKSDYKTGNNSDKVYFYYHQLEDVKNEMLLYGFHKITIELVDYKTSNANETHTIVIAKK